MRKIGKAQHSPVAAITLLCAATLTLAAAPSANAQTYTGQVIMSGLLNPRGVTFSPDGSLYVAEAGIGGNGPSITSGDGSVVSYGATGGLTRYKDGVQTRLVSDLPSLADQAATPPGGGSSGLHRLAVGGDGNLYGVIGFGADPALRDTLTAAGAPGQNFGQLVRFNTGATPSVDYVTDIAAYEAANNPDGGDINSNAYGLTATPDGFAVTDAGGNSLLAATGNGAGGFALSSLATFPDVPNPLFDPNNPATGGPFYQAVPTSVTAGAGGTLYVSELTGYPFIPGAANIFTVTPGSGTVGVVPGGGFTNLIDVIYSPVSGSLYALQLTTNGLASPTGPGAGQLIRVNPLTGERTTIYSGLFFPGGVALGADGAFYISNLSVAPGGGQVIRVAAAAPEPGSLAFLMGASLLTMAGGIIRRRKP